MAQNTHQIDYSLPHVKTFLQQLNAALTNAEQLRAGVEQTTFEQLWCQLASKDLATVYLTVLMGKLVIMESKAIERKNSSYNSEDVNTEDNTNVLQLVEQLKLGTQKYEPNHPLLFKRGETIKNRVRRTVIDVDDTLNGSTTTASTIAGSSTTISPTSVKSLLERQWFSEYALIERSAILNSLIYVSLFYKFDPQDASLLSLLDTWIKLRQTTFVANGVDYIAEEIRESLCPPKEALFKYIQFSCDYEVMEEGMQSLLPPLHKYDPLTMAAAYVYPRLQTICRFPGYSDMVLDEITALVNHPINLQEPQRLRNVLSFLKLILPQLYVDSEEKIKVFMKALIPYFMQPQPIGGLVLETLSICKKELTYRGSSMRERFEKTIKRVKEQTGNIAEKRRIVHILLNPNAANANNFIDKFDVFAELNEDELDIAKANLTLNVFDEIDKKMSDELLKVPIEVLSQYYRQAAAIQKDMEDKKQDKSARLNEFQKLKDSIIATGKESMSRRFITVSPHPNPTRQKSPKLPEIGFNVIVLPYEEDITKNKMELRIFLRTNMIDIIQELVTKAKAENPDANSSPVLDIAIAGGSGTIQRFVHSVTVANKLKILTGVDIKIYIIPLGENNYLAGWLEKYDGWYSRHLYHPVLSPIPLIPQLKTPNTTKDAEKMKILKAKPNNPPLTSSNSGSNLRKGTILATAKVQRKNDAAQITTYKAPKKFLTPHRFMRTLLSDYFTDAAVTVPLYVYNVQCLTYETVGNPNTPNDKLQRLAKVKNYVSYSFCQRFEVGVLAEAAQFQKNEKVEALTLEELEKKNFKYKDLEVVMSYVPMDPTGETTRISEIAEPLKKYQTIQIKNCAMCGDKGDLISPIQPWLEVYAEESQKKPKKLASSSSYHVSTITVDTTTTQMFSVLLDGELYGPFHRIIVNPADRTLNLQTFTKPVIF